MKTNTDFDVYKTLSYGAEFKSISKRFELLKYPKANGSVGGNSALSLYGAARHYGCARALDIGTHLGKSALLLASAISFRASHPSGYVLSVDVRDVTKPDYTMRNGTPLPMSALQLLQHFQLDHAVTFVTGKSLQVMPRLASGFDLIMLDGAHDAATVYIELLLAQTLLRPGGILAMHDVYPGLLPIEASSKKVIKGPWLALEKLLTERPDLTYVKVPGPCSLAYVLSR
jgi:predicted O-methyltransferase YrrM